MPSSDNAEGLVALTFNKKEEEIRYEFPYIQTFHGVCALCCSVFGIHFRGLRSTPTQS
jgi:hypothetical protein